MRSRLQRGRLPGGTGLLLVPAAALLVHQLRYTLTYGSQAGAQLAATGHSYQHSLVPWVVLTLGRRPVVVPAARGARGAERRDRAVRASVRRPVSGRVTTVGLLAIYAVQESLEELYASGHPTGFAGVFGHGGWWAIPVGRRRRDRRRRAAPRRPRGASLRRPPRGARRVRFRLADAGCPGGSRCSSRRRRSPAPRRVALHRTSFAPAELGAARAQATACARACERRMDEEAIRRAATGLRRHSRFPRVRRRMPARRRSRSTTASCSTPPRRACPASPFRSSTAIAICGSACTARR